MSGDPKGRRMESGAAPAQSPEPGAISRRGALKVIATGAALGAAASCAPEDGARSAESAHEALSGFDPLPPSNPLAAGTAADPDLLAPVVPWETVLADEEMRLVAALADVIIPADERSPAASAVGVPDYVDEFVSAPAHTEQLTQLRGGLAWLNREARERFGAADFPALTLERQHDFFDQFRDMVSTGFWTTEEGMRDLGYVGNIPLPSFDGPPPEVLERLGLAGEDLV